MKVSLDIMFAEENYGYMIFFCDDFFRSVQMFRLTSSKTAITEIETKFVFSSSD